MFDIRNQPASGYVNIDFILILYDNIISLGRLIKSSALMVMRPDDMIEFGRQTYAKAKSIDAWNRQDILRMGLNPEEMTLLEKLPLKKGKLL
ncbi:MAG: hypothetical protein JRI87_11020 [Deltaproteobacteria bacterium]|nr:hypothetical protein [Deltaproteobacteria bacterium]